LLVEAQGGTPTLRSNWEAAQSLTRDIRTRFDVDLDRYDQILDIFEPRGEGSLAMWHAVCFRPDAAPSFKVYFDAQARGRWDAPAVVEQALDRLGFRRVWPRIRELGGDRFGTDELKYVSLDLAHFDHPRVKVYWRHHGLHLPELLHRVQRAQGRAEQTGAFVRAMTRSDGPFSTRPLFSCTALLDPASSEPGPLTIYVPIIAYARHDADVVERVGAYLREHDLDADRYLATIEAMSGRPLDTTASLHSYVSIKASSQTPHVTVYYSPESRPTVSQSTSTAIPDPLLPAEEIVRRYEHEVALGQHPFFQRLAREEVSLPHLWLVMANFWEAFVHDFPERVAKAIANFDTDELRCVFVKQLNDELGEGDIERAHKPMFKRLVDALEPWRMDGDYEHLVAPGRRLGERMNEHLHGPDPYEAVGALMMIEIFGKQNDLLLGEQFRRQNELDREALTWLHLHEELEVDHADDSLVVARLLPAPGRDDAKLQGAWRGAVGLVDAAMEYFDGLYARCWT